MKSFQTLVSGVAAVLLVIGAVDVKGGPATVTNVTSQLKVQADSSAPVFFSDGHGQNTPDQDEYVTTAGKAPVSSVLQRGGDWQLDTTSTSRAVWLDLVGPPSPFNGQYVHALLTTHCASTGSTP